MGNATTPSHPLPQIWERINSAFLRHRYTQEIIEEHTVTTSSHDQLLALVGALKKRIALHHMSIAKVIYFQSADQRQLCSHLQPHQLLLYTEYTGDSLQEVVEEKGERMYHTPCQCTHILSAADYLRQHHGCFLLTPSMVFLGNRKEKNTKVWVHSKVEVSEREFPASEEQMCQSVADLLRYIKHNKICTAFSDEHLENAQRMRRMAELKMLVYDLHRVREDQTRVKKANSVSIAQSRENEGKVYEERQEQTKKLHSVKANSMPQKDEEGKMHPKTVQMPQLKGRDLNEPGQYYTRILNQNLNLTNNYKSHQRNIPTSDMLYRPVQATAPLRINFMYPKQQKSQAQNRLDVSLPQKREAYQTKEKEQSISKNDLIIKNMKENDEKPSLFSPHLGTFVHSATNSPDGIKLTIDPGNFTAREMELPLPDASEKITPARLPTTSRSPKIAKDIETKSIQNPIEIIPALPQRKIVKLPSKGGQKYEKPSSVNSSGNKFQKYKDAIKNYEQKLRQKLANSTGNANPVKAKNKVMVRKSVSSPKGGEFKQTKSVYNDSDDQPAISIQPKPKNEPIQPRFPSQNNYNTDESIPEKQIEQSNRKQPSEQQQRSNKKARQHMEKLQLQRQLEKEKQMIHNEMQDLFKQNAMKDEYRSIREKIKQKKETFAQLKAQATKILEDLDY